jgi:hypothetical protein
MFKKLGVLSALAIVTAAAQPGQAASFSLDLSGNVANFVNFQAACCGFKFNEFSLDLTGLDATNAITVSQGDTIHSLVTLDQAYTIPMSPDRTDLLLYLGGSAFPSEDTAVQGTFTFFNGAVEVASFGFNSSTSTQLSAFSALFPPNNTALTFDSFTNDLTITNLLQPATLDSANFTYSLDTAVPEPAAWAMMLCGFGVIGTAMRGRRKVSVAFA